MTIAKDPGLQAASGRGERILALAERIVAGSMAGRPADEVLRKTLASERGLLPGDSAQVSRAVFSFHRWRGWLPQDMPPGSQIKEALRMADEFARDPRKFEDDDILERAVPPWVRSHVDASAAWARALQGEPKLWLRARPGHGARLAKRLGHCVPFGDGPLSDALEYRGRNDLFSTPEFHAGEFELQDISSQAVGLICAPGPGETWWDACAGEGGKTMHLAGLMENKGLIWATDRSEWRLRALKRRAARARVFNYRAALWNGGLKLPTRTKFDGVLVDAPCSGIGTWQRNPHARWTTTEQDVRELAAVQRQLLDHAAPALKPGAKLVYAVCTLARAETVEVARAFEETHRDFKPALIQNPLGKEAGAAADLWLWPQQHGGNGMFVAAWTRNS